MLLLFLYISEQNAENSEGAGFHRKNPAHVNKKSLINELFLWRIRQDFCVLNVKIDLAQPVFFDKINSRKRNFLKL